MLVEMCEVAVSLMSTAGANLRSYLHFTRLRQLSDTVMLQKIILAPPLFNLEHKFIKYISYGYRSTQPCISPGSLNRVPTSAGVRAGMSSLPGVEVLNV